MTRFKRLSVAFSSLTALGLALGCASKNEQPAPKLATADAAEPRACTLTGTATLEPFARASSTLALARSAGRTLAFVSDEDTSRVIVVDVDTKRELAHLDVGSPPAGIVVAPSGRVAVAMPRRSEIRVLAFEANALTSVCAVAAPAEPVALSFTPDHRELFVTSAWGHALTTFESDGMRETRRVLLPREPRAVVVSEDGKRAFIAHAVGSTLTIVDLPGASAEKLALHSVGLGTVPISDSDENFALLKSRFGSTGLDKKRLLEIAEQSNPPRSGNQSFALALSVDPPGRVLVPEALVDPGPKSASQGYGRGGAAAVAAAVAVVNTKTLEREHESVKAPPAWGTEDFAIGHEPCRLPRAAAVDPKSGLLLVTCLGVDQLVGYDAAAPNPVDAEGFRVRVPSGPTGLAIDAEKRRAVVWSQFERALGVVRLPDAGAPLSAKDPVATSIALAAVPNRGLTPELALGRRLFHASDDPRIAKDGRACANCHVSGRDDSLVWSTPQGPRRTKTLAGIVDGSAPYSWDGAAGNLHDQIASTFERLSAQGGLHGPDLEALLKYVAALPAPPRTSDDRDPALVKHGAELFASAKTGCSVCHTGVASTDGGRHDVRSDSDVDQTTRFDTPSLRFLEGRAPFFHDGRYASLRELLVASDGKMGHTKDLSANDLDALEAFLTTL